MSFELPDPQRDEDVVACSAPPESSDGCSAAYVEPKLPDEMGIWTDGGDVVWLPVRYYPNRRGAFRFAREQWQATPRDIFVTHAWMRFDPAGDEERWSECEGDDPGAFACWRIEAA